MQLNNSDFSTTPYPTHRSLRLFPRAPSRGLDHTTLIIIIAVSVSVGGFLLTILIWRFLSRLSRPESAPLPPRQSLVHLRELHIAAFSEYKDASAPQVGSYIHETDEATLNSSDAHLHPPSPQFFSSRATPSGSSSSLRSSNDDSALSSGDATPPTQFSTSGSLSPSSRRAMNPSGPRPLSTFSTSSRQSIRAAPHAPHSNVQVILPAPLAPSLYDGTTSDGSLLQRTARNSTYSVPDGWRRSLADSWIPVGLPNSEPMERQDGHDSAERPARLIRRGSSPGPRSPRSRSNPSSPSRLRPSSGLDQLPEGTHPPVPPLPSEFGTRSGHRALTPSTPSRKGGSLTPSPSSTHSHKPRS